MAPVSTTTPVVNLVRIFDGSGEYGDYDLYLLTTLDEAEAIPLVDAAIRQVKDAKPDEWDVSDIYAILTPLGFSVPEKFDATEVL